MIVRAKTKKTDLGDSLKNCIQIKLTLAYISPPIWRRIVVPDFFTLEDLHYIIQFSMGWENCHLHAFRIGETNYTSEESAGGDMGMEDESQVLLKQVAGRVKTRFHYEYDFGDSWIHEILVEKILPFDSKINYPVCTGGARACPPEDCGSYPGYENILEALDAPKKDQEQKELLQWLGKYDPEAFPIEKVNRNLKRIKKKG